jgi:hypothetical protein
LRKAARLAEAFRARLELFMCDTQTAREARWEASAQRSCRRTPEGILERITAAVEGYAVKGIPALFYRRVRERKELRQLVRAACIHLAAVNTSAGRWRHRRLVFRGYIVQPEA